MARVWRRWRCKTVRGVIRACNNTGIQVLEGISFRVLRVIQKKRVNQKTHRSHFDRLRDPQNPLLLRPPHIGILTIDDLDDDLMGDPHPGLSGRLRRRPQGIVIG